MIRLINVTKSYRCGAGRKSVLSAQSYCFSQGGVVGLLGRNGAGKSSLLRLLAGVSVPDSGEIVRSGTVSWPVAFSGGLHGDMTGEGNIRFVARVYGRDTSSMIDYCRAMSELGDYLKMPVRTFSSGMRARLAFAMSMAVPFDFYLIDEVISVGDVGFRQKCEGILAQRLEKTGGIIVSHAPATLRRLCNIGLVLENGRLIEHTTIDSAIAHHERSMRVDA